MNTFLNKLHSTSGLFVLVISLVFGYVLDIFIGRGTPILGLMFLLFFLFTLHALVTSVSSNKILKLYLVIVLIVTSALIAIDFYWAVGSPENPASGYLTGYAMVIGIPLLLIGLLCLFRSEKRG